MDESQSDSTKLHIPYSSTWEIHVDEVYAERMIHAHNKAYRRNTGKGYFIFCLLLDVLVIAGTIKCFADGLNLFDQLNGFGGIFGAYILFPGLTIFFGILAFGPDKGGFFGCKRAARQLAKELVPQGSGTLTAHLDELGITLSSSVSTTNIPYAACYDTATIDNKTFVLVGSEKEQSAAYAAAGVNAYLRDNVGFAFAAPEELANRIIEVGKQQFDHMKKDDDYCTRVLDYMGE